MYRCRLMIVVTAQLRMIFLLVLFTLGLAAHDVAMASGPMPGQSPWTSAISSTTDNQQRVGQGCGACNHAGHNCCFLGQCLVGVAPLGVTINAPVQVADRRTPAASILLQTMLYRPYRPPASL